VELGGAGLIAGVVSAIYYRAMLRYSLRGDMTSMQLEMKNLVLYVAILILTFGIASPKRRLLAALMMAPLALLPFAILLAVCLRHPRAMEGLARWTEPATQLRNYLNTATRPEVGALAGTTRVRKPVG